MTQRYTANGQTKNQFDVCAQKSDESTLKSDKVL